VTLNCTLVPNPCLTIRLPLLRAGDGRPNSEHLSVTRDYAQPYVQQGRLGVERELIRNLSLSVTYLYFRGVHLSRTRDIISVCRLATTLHDPPGRRFRSCAFPRSYGSGFTRISLFESTGQFALNGLAVELKRPSPAASNSSRLHFSSAKDNKPDQTMVVVGTDVRQRPK